MRAWLAVFTTVAFLLGSFAWVPTAFSASALTDAPGISAGPGAAIPAYWWHPEVSWLEAQYPAVHWNDRLSEPIDLTTWMTWVRFVGHQDLPVPKGISRMALVESLAPLFESAPLQTMGPALPFADAPSPDDPRFPLIQKAYGLKILQGYPDGTLRLSQQATRSEALTLLARALRVWESVAQDRNDPLPIPADPEDPAPLPDPNPVVVHPDPKDPDPLPDPVDTPYSVAYRVMVPSEGGYDWDPVRDFWNPVYLYHHADPLHGSCLYRSGPSLDPEDEWDEAIDRFYYNGVLFDPSPDLPRQCYLENGYFHGSLSGDDVLLEYWDFYEIYDPTTSPEPDYEIHYWYYPYLKECNWYFHDDPANPGQMRLTNIDCFTLRRPIVIKQFLRTPDTILADAPATLEFQSDIWGAGWTEVYPVFSYTSPSGQSYTMGYSSDPDYVNLEFRDDPPIIRPVTLTFPEAGTYTYTLRFCATTYLGGFEASYCSWTTSGTFVVESPSEPSLPEPEDPASLPDPSPEDPSAFFPKPMDPVVVLPDPDDPNPPLTTDP
ncbi:MAG: S-layer homology domain-containing protein [Clostridiales bacterium]|nr:S-layer homology domain-containing protein [Clostridiales bacterium]